MTEWW